jgi:hypothetical protein
MDIELLWGNLLHKGHLGHRESEKITLKFSYTNKLLGWLLDGSGPASCPVSVTKFNGGWHRRSNNIKGFLQKYEWL